MQCEKCQKREATVHLTLVGPADEVCKRDFCEPCYRIVQEARAAGRLPFAQSEAKGIRWPLDAVPAVQQRGS